MGCGVIINDTNGGFLRSVWIYQEWQNLDSNRNAPVWIYQWVAGFFTSQFVWWNHQIPGRASCWAQEQALSLSFFVSMQQRKPAKCKVERGKTEVWLIAVWTFKFSLGLPSVLHFQHHLRGFDQKVYQHHSGGCARWHASKSTDWWRVLVHQRPRCVSSSSCARGLGAWWKLLGN